MDKKELLVLRKIIKTKKPKFIRQDAHKKTRLRKKWKKPRGWQSKVRLHKKGYRKEVSKGYGSPKAVAGLHKSGLKMITIHSLKELENIEPKENGIVISKTTGLKKKIEIIKKSKEKGIIILNIKNPEEFVKNIEESMDKKKQEKTKKTEEKEKKKKEAEKKADEEKKKDKLSEKVTDEEKKDQDKKEKDKLLTKKE